MYTKLCFYQNIIGEAEMVVQACSSQLLERSNKEFEASLSNIVRPFFKKNKTKALLRGKTHPQPGVP